MYDHTHIASYRRWGARSVGSLRLRLLALDGRDPWGFVKWPHSFSSAPNTPTKASPLFPPRNVVAALDSDSGRLIWRHKFEEEDAVGRILDLAAAGKYVVSASGSANIFLRLWEPTKGVLVQVGERFFQCCGSI